MQAEKSQFNTFTTQKGNIIWAGALTLAWQQLIKSFIKQPIQIQDDDKQAKQIVNNFNTSKFSQNQIDEKSIYVKSGYGPKTLAEINSQCRKKFPQKSFSDLNMNLKQKDIIAYAYLLKKLEFLHKFQRSKGNNFFFKGLQVPSFSAPQKQQLKQIRYYYYENENKFMISIDSKSMDQIYLIKNPKITCVQQAINQVLNKKKKSKLQKDDQFQMPVIQLDLKHDIIQLQGKSIANKNLNGYIFGSVYQRIKLNVDQSGVKLENQAVIMMLGCCISQKEPKRFILNNDFWIVMKQTNKYPYFCALIKNPKDLS